MQIDITNDRQPMMMLPTRKQRERQGMMELMTSEDVGRDWRPLTAHWSAYMRTGDAQAEVAEVAEAAAWSELTPWIDDALKNSFHTRSPDRSLFFCHDKEIFSEIHLHKSIYSHNSDSDQLLFEFWYI